jgi:atypical dual specificity phosphatase
MPIMNFSWVIDGKLAGHQAPASEQDLIFLKKQGVLALVRMIEQKEAQISIEQIGNQGMWDCHEPIADFGVPNPEQLRKIIEFIDKSISEKRPVGVSCKAGYGRTGTILACYLVKTGYKQLSSFSLH